MDLCSISKNTYYDCIKELVEKGFITHTRQENRALLSKISLNILYQNLVNEQDTTYDSNCDSNHDTTCDSSSTLIKQLNNKPKNKTIELQFNEFWNGYNKKTGKDKSIKKWNSLTDLDREDILKAFPDYVKSTPDKKFRKDPITYLNGSHWKDEIIIQESKSTDLTQGFKLGKKPTGSVYHV
jgi:hypothetical protein